MSDKAIEELKRMNKLLVLMITKGMNQSDTVEILLKAGFQSGEISELTGIKSSVVRQTVYMSKKKK